MDPRNDLSLVGFTTAVMVSTYMITDKKWATVLGGIAGYCTYKFLVTGEIKTQDKDKKKKKLIKEEEKPEEPPTPPPRTPKRKVVAFDFDKCLMLRHWWGTFRNMPLDQINPQPEDFAHKNLKKLLTDLLSRTNINVAVASFGRGDVIKKAIESVLDAELADRIFITTPSDYPPYTDGQSMGNKNTQLQQISDKFSTPVQDIIFFDDDKRNIQFAKEYGINAQWSAPFCEDHEHLIYEHLQA